MIIDLTPVLGDTGTARLLDVNRRAGKHAMTELIDSLRAGLPLRRKTLGFRNLTHYRWRSPLYSGALHAL